MDLWPAVFDIGAVVTGWGEIRDDADGLWFDPPHPVPLIFLGGGRRLPRSMHAVRLLGDAWAAATPGPDRTGAVRGWATVTGVWLGDSIEVLSVNARTPAVHSPDSPMPNWTTPPCPVPALGWPRGSQEDIIALDLASLQSSDNCVTTVTFRPRPDSVVMVVVAEDVVAAESAWRPALGSRLCVVQSRWSKRQLEQVTNVLLEHWQDWAISMVSRPVDDDAQSRVDAEFLRITPDIANWAADLADGIFEAKPTLLAVDR